MKNKEKLYSIALASTVLVLLLLIFGSTVASAAQETQLTQTSRLLMGPSINGNIVTWTDNAAISAHMYDLTTGKQMDLPGGVDSAVHAYGNKIVWTDMVNDNVRMYDVSTGKETQIASNGFSPDIYENSIVYTKYPDGSPSGSYRGVYLYDLTTSKETQITSNGSSPDIYGNSIVYTKYVRRRSKWFIPRCIFI